MRDYIIRNLVFILSLSGFPTILQGQLAGGNGDGYAAGTFVGLLNGDSLSTYSSGGDGDGFSHSRRGGFLQGPGITDPLQGGDGDGFAADDFIGLLSGLSTRRMFSSGDGDGFAHARTTGFLQGVAFPIALLSFEARLEKDEVYLHWITESEINHDFFTIERSEDAHSFQAIIQIPGSGNTQSVQTYQSVDRDPLSGYSYYRLKSTDLDGSFSYSKVVAIRIEPASTWALAIFPNPNTGKTLKLHFTGFEAEASIELEIVNMLGVRVFSQSIRPKTSTFEMNLELNHQLAKGHYLVRLRSAEQQLSKVLILQ